jgi:hypothetical protein
MRILDQGRTITALVDYEGILKMVGARGLPLASTVTFNKVSSADYVQKASLSRSLSRWQALPAAKA